MSSTHETAGDQVKTVDTKGSGDEKPAVSNIDYSHSRDARHTSSSDGSVSDNEDKEATIGKHEPAEVDHEAEQKLEEAHLSAAEIEEHNFSPEEYKSTLRRIDMVMMPFMCLAVLLQFIDKTSLNYAHLLKIQDDLNFTARDYSWLGSIFYIGYLFSSPVHGLMLQKLPLTRYLGAMLFLWGATLILHAAAFNYAGLVACRLFLGIFEGALTPGFILVTGRFYKSKEQVSRTVIWFLQNGVAQILGGGIGYGVLTQKPSNLKVWQELFLILGAITLAYSLTVFFFMPEDPRTSRFLTERQRVIAIQRVRENKTGLHDRRLKWYQVREAFLDVRLYIVFVLIFTTDMANAVSSNFSTAIISGLGFNQKRTALLGMANGGSEVVSLLLAIVIAYMTNTRWAPSCFALLVSIVGGAMVIGSSGKIVQLVGFVLTTFFAVAAALLYSWISSAVGGSTKRTVFNTTLQLGYCAGNIVGPQLAGTAPDYRQGKLLMLIMFALSAVSVCAMSSVHYVWNKMRNRVNAGKDDPPLSELADHTDMELRSFRYPL